jgi:hypothetical protein
LRLLNWIDDSPSRNHAEQCFELVGLFDLPEGARQIRVQAATPDPAAWRRIMEAIETLGSLNLALENLPILSDRTRRYGIDLVGHRIEYVIDEEGI